MAKNIVLLSDGTGNSSAKLLKTNVWRIYESLQLTDPNVQVACYDDGVGTSTFKPLALAGGAVGVGLRRNVLRLYRFLCEHYDPGDRIFLFGFSRGAFTIRVLAGMICDQGVIKTRPTLPVEGATASMPAGAAPPGQATSGEAVLDRRAIFDGVVYGSELARLTRWAYRDFRRLFDQTGGLVKGARKLRDWSFRLPEWAKGLRRYDKSRNYPVDAIEFVGVWDTVDAYGLPIDELTDGIDRWVWPLSMPTLNLNRKVQRACHVLALDDERNTFHPVLWDESDPEMAKRISQVWFAGMHSNVGGGYPDDALSYVSLNWMTQQAAARNLLFVRDLLEHHTAKADPFGRIYDSREGLKGYYRYNPRRIDWLTNGQTHEFGMASPTVNVALPKIHESVFKRIAAAPEAYAPIVFPQHYAVVMETGEVVTGDDNPYEPPAAATRRVAAQEACWNLVWLRRIVYFATVGTTLYFLAQPLRVPLQKPIEFGAVASTLEFGRSFVPDLASRWISYYQVHTRAFVIQLGAILLLMSIGRRLKARICNTMRGIWLKVVPPAREEWKTLRDSRSALSTMRNSRPYQGASAFLRRKFLPNFFGLLILAWLIGAANRLPFEVINASGAWCKGGGAVALAPDVPTPSPVFASSEFCRATGIQLDAGQKYRIELSGAGSPSWRDGGVHVPSPAGVTWSSPGLKPWHRIVFAAGVPFRRVWSTNWFVPIARVGRTGIQQYPLNAASVEITPRRSGELFLFVNDAIAPPWKRFYSNNEGTAQVTVTKVKSESVKGEE